MTTKTLKIVLFLNLAVFPYTSLGRQTYLWNYVITLYICLLYACHGDYFITWNYKDTFSMKWTCPTCLTPGWTQCYHIKGGSTVLPTTSEFAIVSWLKGETVNILLGTENREWKRKKHTWLNVVGHPSYNAIWLRRKSADKTNKKSLGAAWRWWEASYIYIK